MRRAVVPAFLAVLAVAATGVTALFLYPYTRLLTINLYHRMDVGILGFWLLAGVVGFALAKLLKLQPIVKRRATVWTLVAAAIPVFLYYQHVPPLNRGAQKRSMADMRRMARELEAFKARTGNYPIANTIHDLSIRLGSKIPETDGWGTPFGVECSGKGCTIISYGADGRPDAAQMTGAASGWRISC